MVLYTRRGQILDTSTEEDVQDKIIQTHFQYDEDDKLVQTVSYRKKVKIGWETYLYEFIGDELTARILKRADGPNHSETRHGYNEKGLLSRWTVKHEESKEETIHGYATVHNTES